MAKLYLICGHGDGDPGACAGGVKEADQVRELAQLVKQRGGSSVEVLDPSKNWFKETKAGRGLQTLSLPAGAMVLELHRDSVENTEAKGAHVIIKDGYKADSFDEKLAQNLAKIFPGRPVTLVGRSNLLNVNAAARRGINYRLAEVGFISNAEDRKIFAERKADIADAILDAAGIKASHVAATPTAAPNPVTPADTKAETAKLDLDGNFGPATVRRAQTLAGTPVDGVVSSQASPDKKYVPSRTSAWQYVAANWYGSNLVEAVQKKVGAKVDGLWGEDTSRRVQKRLAAMGYDVGKSGSDGYFGPDSCKAFQRMLNDGKFL